jgi:hypothetical protein
VDAAACDFNACIEGLFDGVKAAKDGDLGAVTGSVGAAGTIIGEQSGMNVDDAVGEVREEIGAEDAHPPGEDDKVYLEFAEQVAEAGFALCARLPGKKARWNAGILGAHQAIGVWLVTDDEGDLNAREFLAFNGVNQGLQVGAGAGDEDAETIGRLI